MCEILKNCPKGTKFYSTIHGEVQFLEVKESDKDYPIIIIHDNIKQTFAKDGKFIIEHKDSECTIFPSKDQRDWSKWQCPKPKFDPKTLKVFDRVLVSERGFTLWSVDFFCFVGNKDFKCIGGYFNNCIPYNDDTKHLVGTSDEAPEYYRYWED